MPFGWKPEQNQNDTDCRRRQQQQPSKPEQRRRRRRQHASSFPRIGINNPSFWERIGDRQDSLILYMQLIVSLEIICFVYLESGDFSKHMSLLKLSSSASN